MKIRLIKTGRVKAMQIPEVSKEKRYHKVVMMRMLLRVIVHYFNFKAPSRVSGKN